MRLGREQSVGVVEVTEPARRIERFEPADPGEREIDQVARALADFPADEEVMILPAR